MFTVLCSIINHSGLFLGAFARKYGVLKSGIIAVWALGTAKEMKLSYDLNDRPFYTSLFQPLQRSNARV